MIKIFKGVKKIQLNFKAFYIKWVLGQCHGKCSKCSYYNMCWENIEDE